MHGGAGLAATLIIIFSLFWYGVFWVAQLFVCWFLYKCFKRIPLKSRRLGPSQVWLLLIPGVHLIHNFIVFLRLSDSFRDYFTGIEDSEVGSYGKRTAIVYCVSCCLWPLLVIGAWAKTDAAGYADDIAVAMYWGSHLVGIGALVFLGGFLATVASLRDRLPSAES